MVNLLHKGVLDLVCTHSEHANMTYQDLLHLYCIQSGLLAKATELSLAQGKQQYNLRPCSIKTVLPPFYAHVISFTRPSSRLIFGERVEREEGLGTRIFQARRSLACRRMLSLPFSQHGKFLQALLSGPQLTLASVH